MNYTKEERLEIGRQIYTHEITIGEASEKFNLNWYTVRDYMRQYRDLNGLPPMADGKDALKILNKAKKKNFDDLESLSREELIDEVIKARVETERAKKGYAVKGGGAQLIHKLIILEKEPFILRYLTLFLIYCIRKKLY